MKSREYRLNEVCLEITGACPMNCLHCSGDCDLGSHSILSLEQINGVIDELCEIGGKILEISGGEPLMVPYISQIVRYAVQSNVEPILYTSGSVFDDAVVRELRESGLEKVVFSLQGSKSQTHEAITQTEGSFARTTAAIGKMKKLGFWVGVHFVPMKPNYSEFRTLLELCESLNVDEVGVLRFVPQGRGLLNRSKLELPREKFREFVGDLAAQGSANPTIRVGCPIDFRHLLGASLVGSTCSAGISKCHINSDGTVVPCPAFKQSKQYVAGNIKNKSLTEIWDDSPILQGFRDFDHKQINEPCRSCEYLDKCRGKCIAQRTLECNNMYAAPDPKCFAPHLLIELPGAVRRRQDSVPPIWRRC